MNSAPNYTIGVETHRAVAWAVTWAVYEGSAVYWLITGAVGTVGAVGTGAVDNDLLTVMNPAIGIRKFLDRLETQ
jgi:hypothetical protein